MRTRNHGLATIEFAISGLVMFTILFGVLEFGRLMYTWNTVAEATRRAARLAAVCPLNNDAVLRAALMTTDTSLSSTSPYISGLSRSNVLVEYLKADSQTTTTTQSEVQYVRVGITGYTMALLIPGFDLSLTVPSFTTIVPAESLGYVPDDKSTQCLSL